MAKKFKHMGMEITEEEHERWHRERNEVIPDLHKHLMEKMGMSKEEDTKWHEKHGKTPKISGE